MLKAMRQRALLLSGTIRWNSDGKRVHGHARVKYEGVDGVIENAEISHRQNCKSRNRSRQRSLGYSANYKVVQVTVDGDIAFVVLYG